MSENGCSNCSDNVLSEEEANAIKESFAVIWRDKKENGINIFVKLFTLYPEAQHKFEDFRGITIEEVRIHKKLRAHALSVVYALKSFIDNLDDVETLAELIKKNARNHMERTVTEKEIKWLVPVVIEVLGDIMGEKMTKLHQSSWTKLFGVITSLWKEEQDSCTEL